MAEQIANDSISIPILINLTSGVGYRRKALKVLNDLVKLHEITDLRLKK